MDLLTLIVLGALLYFVEKEVPAPSFIKTVLRIIVVIWVLVMLMRFLGVPETLHLPRG